MKLIFLKLREVKGKYEVQVWHQRVKKYNWKKGEFKLIGKTHNKKVWNEANENKTLLSICFTTQESKVEELKKEIIKNKITSINNIIEWYQDMNKRNEEQIEICKGELKDLEITA